MSLYRLQTSLAWFGGLFERGLYLVCGVLLTFLSFSMFCAVLSRYVLRAPLPWTEELARFALVWFALLSAALAARRGVHISFRWGLLLFSERARLFIRIAVELLVIAFLATVLWQGMTMLTVVGNQTALATQINMSIPYAAIPVGCGVLILAYMLEVLDSILSLWTGQSLSIKSAQEADTFRRLQKSGEILPAPLARPE